MRKHFSGSAFARECPYSSGIHRRAAVFFAFCAVAFTLLYLRVGYLSRSPGLAQTARQQSKYTLAVSKTRGGIYDCRLRPLVNEEQEKVWAVLPSAENLTAVRKAVPASRRGEVSEQLKNGKPFLLRGVSDIEAPGADAFFVPVRSRDRQLAAHIVGYTDGGVAGDWGKRLLNKAAETSTGKALLSNVPQKVVDFLGTLSKNKVAQVVGTGLEEGFENLTEYDLQRMWQNLILDEDTPYDIRQAMSEAASGVLFGSIMAAGNAAGDTLRTKYGDWKEAWQDAKADRIYRKYGPQDMEEIGFREIKAGDKLDGGKAFPEFSNSFNGTEGAMGLLNAESRGYPPVFTAKNTGKTYMIPNIRDIEYGISKDGTVLVFQDGLRNVNKKDQREFIKQYAAENYITSFDNAGNIIGPDRSITIDSDGTRVYITNQGINDVGKKIRGGTENSMANSMLVLPQLIKTANFVEEVPDQKSRDFLWRNYVGRYRYDGQDYAVMLKVKVPPTGSDRYYYHTLDKIEIDPLHVRLANTTSLLELIRKESISDEGILHTPAQEYESLTHNIPQTEENSKPKNLAESPVDTILNAGQGPAAENPAVDADAETKAVETLLQPAKERETARKRLADTLARQIIVNKDGWTQADMEEARRIRGRRRKTNARSVGYSE